MKNLNLFQILQNPMIGVIAIHSFIMGYNAIVEGKQRKEDPPLDYLFYVLPIIFNNSSLESFKSSYELYTALSKDRTLTLGLQERANKMSVQTLESLNLGFSKKIFSLNNENYSVGVQENFLARNILSKMKIGDEHLKKVRKASFQLGNMFAKKDKKMIQLTLDIRF